ncbi:hypothetical protein GCM10010975_30220 [Comamonas phosphati]|nr:hypothetical protein GCM10010975_30220 [Comamonas phosphati]
MTPIPRWSSSMSVKDPLLDAQHIELLEICRSMQSDLEREGPQGWTFLQRLDEFAFLLRAHDAAEASALRRRGQDLPYGLHAQRASALRDIEALASNSHSEKFDPVVMQYVLCGWIQYHFDARQGEAMRIEPDRGPQSWSS